MISLAGRDILHSWSKFVLTGIGLGLLIGVTLTMAGVYRGMVDDARALLDNSGADLWVVQQDTQGPYAESSSLRDDAVRSVLGLPGVARAANVTYLTMQVRRASVSGVAPAGSGDDDVRAMVVGFEPGQPGEPGYLVAGRQITRSHYEAVADVRTGFTLGERIRIRRHDYTVVGLTRRMVSSGGDPMVFIPLKDAQEAQFLKDNDAIVNERARTAANPSLNRPGVPGLLEAIQASQANNRNVNAILVQVQPGIDAEAVLRPEDEDSPGCPPREVEDEDDQGERPDGSVVPDPPQPLDDVVSDVLLSRRLKARRQLDPGEEPGAQEHCGALSAEGEHHPHREEESPDRGAQEFVGDEVAGHRPSTRDPEIRLGHDHRDDRPSARVGELLSHADEQERRQHRPDRYPTGDDGGREPGDDQRPQHVRDDHEATTVDPIGQRAGIQADDEVREALHDGRRRDEGRVAGLRGDQQWAGGQRDPIADVADPGRCEVPPEGHPHPRGSDEIDDPANRRHAQTLTAQCVP